MGIHANSSNKTFLEAEAFMKIWLGYRSDKVDMFTSIKLYDSKCRNCEEWEYKNKWERTTLKEVKL